MTSGRIRASWLLPLFALLLTRNTAGLALEVTAPSGGPANDGWTVEQVVTSLAEGRQTAVSFEEATYSSLLTEPLIVRGVLRFLPPTRLEKEVLEPYREHYIIEGDQVTFESERKRVKKTISLEDYPALRSFVEAFRAGLTGDAAQLKRTYETRLEGSRREWVLWLRPHDPAGKAIVDSIQFSGSGGRLATITIRAPDGDRSVMTLLRGPVP
jgi:hypothetical protein